MVAVIFIVSVGVVLASEYRLCGIKFKLSIMCSPPTEDYMYFSMLITIHFTFLQL